jgi:hypothetical protein
MEDSKRKQESQPPAMSPNVNYVFPTLSLNLMYTIIEFLLQNSQHAAEAFGVLLG